MIDVLIADDHQIVLDGLFLLIKDIKEAQVVASCNNGIEVLNFLEDNKVDIVLMDISMPKLDGIDTLQDIKKRHKHVKVILISMLGKRSIVQQAFDNQVDGYLLKTVGKREMKKALFEVAGGKTYFMKEIQDIALDLFRTKNVINAIRLTPREKEIIRLICDELTSQEIADKLNIAKGTADTHRKNILHKTGCKTPAGLALFARDNSII